MFTARWKCCIITSRHLSRCRMHWFLSAKMSIGMYHDCRACLRRAQVVKLDHDFGSSFSGVLADGEGCQRERMTTCMVQAWYSSAHLTHAPLSWPRPPTSPTPATPPLPTSLIHTTSLTTPYHPSPHPPPHPSSPTPRGRRGPRPLRFLRPAEERRGLGVLRRHARGAVVAVGVPGGGCRGGPGRGGAVRGAAGRLHGGIRG